MEIELDRARRAWAHAQGLTQRSSGDLQDVVADTGWIRTLGGAEGYLALNARAEGVTVERVHAAVAAAELQVLPSVRGCIYLVPRRHAALSLRIAESLSARRNARDLEKAGATDDELNDVAAAVLDTLAAGPLSTRALARALPDGVVRGLGDAGKKVGVTTTLPPALRKLEFAGRIHRRPQQHRLDHERYDWEIAASNPTAGAPDDPGPALARLFFRWAGPATRDAFCAWSGLGKRDADDAIATVGLEHVDVQGLGAAFAFHEVLEADLPESDRVSLLPALDNLAVLPETPAALVDPADAGVTVAAFGRQRSGPLGQVRQILDRVVAHRGRIAGLWAWDPRRDDVVVRRFADLDVSAEAQGVAGLLRDLGTGKRYSLDNDQTLAAIADRLG